MHTIKVLIVDDSALIRQLLSSVLSQDPAIEVVGTAADPYIAWRKMQTLHPDVLTLDVDMPRMDGLVFLEKLMRLHPMPVVMVSSLTEKGCETTLKALELGAIDFVTKPRIDMQTSVVELAGEIIAKIKNAARATPRPRHPDGSARSFVRPASPPQPRQAVQPPVRGPVGAKSHQTVIGVGASTGGTEALRVFLTALPADAPGIVIVQHMPERFTQSFAKRLDDLCQIRVAEAQDGDRILPGQALIASGHSHMQVLRGGPHYSVRVKQGEPINCHRPSVDVLFQSCAQVLGANAIGVIMTGMGSDGAQGLLAMHQAGAYTIAQDEASCVVFGMPHEAIVAGAVDKVVGLEHISDLVLRRLNEGHTKKRALAQTELVSGASLP